MMEQYNPPWRSEIDIHHEIRKNENKLALLEAQLIAREKEYRDLCLREAEIVGHIPSDYPLQQREPLPPIVDRTIAKPITTVQASFRSNLGYQHPNIQNRQPHSQNPNQNSQQLHDENSRTISQASSPATSSSSSSSNSTRPSRSISGGPRKLVAPKELELITKFLSENNFTISEKKGIIDSCLRNMKQQQEPQQLHKLHVEEEHQKQEINNKMGNKQVTWNCVRPYYEETKPFEMTDFYKYSVRHRSHHQINNQQLGSEQTIHPQIINNNHKLIHHNMKIDEIP